MNVTYKVEPGSTWVPTPGVLVTIDREDIIFLNAGTYRATEDKLAWVSDQTGLSVDHPKCEDIDIELWDMTQL